MSKPLAMTIKEFAVITSSLCRRHGLLAEDDLVFSGKENEKCCTASIWNVYFRDSHEFIPEAVTENALFNDFFATEANKVA